MNRRTNADNARDVTLENSSIRSNILTNSAKSVRPNGGSLCGVLRPLKNGRNNFTVEHITTVSTGILKAVPCSTGGLDIIRAYFSTAFRQVFTVMDYSVLLAVPLGFLNFITASAWNFTDLFIILLACALSDRFKQLNRKLTNIKGRVSSNHCC